MIAPPAALVRPLWEGPIDVVGDVHGEVQALQALLDRLGYGPGGSHPEGRRLVFVGDLVDRGPDSPAVARLVSTLIRAGRAQCVLGNHEFNVLLGSRKPDNFWFFGHEPDKLHPVLAASQKRATAREREEILELAGSLPLALERGDVRVVHACWDADMIGKARGETDVLTMYRRYKARIDEALGVLGVADDVHTKLAHQNRNPVKLLTSGLEEKAPRPFETNGKLRHERRVRWWHDYSDPVLCLFGHYWRTLLQGEADDDRLFVGVPKNTVLGGRAAMCMDYSIGKRWRERHERPGQPFRTQLGALRLPERVLIFDDGQQLPLLGPPGGCS
jgi:hypothetical protein